MLAHTYAENSYWQKWDDDVEFRQIYREISKETLLDARRLYTLCELTRHCRELEGDMAELGVCRGGTARLIAKLAPEKSVHLFDTFTGLPETNILYDAMQKGELSADLDTVREFLSDLKNTHIHPGFFPATTTAVPKDAQFCLVHIDADIYQSIKDACEFFYPRMVSGGFMIFDDYGFYATRGAKKAVDEFLKDKREYPIYLPSCQCAVIKI